MRRIPFKHLYNVRELGGHAVNLYQVTKDHQFLRADAVLALDPEERDFLLQYGVNTIIDLRNDEEIKRHPNCLATDARFTYCHCPLLNRTQMRDQINQMASDLMQRTLPDIYREIIASEAMIKEIFSTLADAKGGVLFHCSAGKDRTGIVTALLLLLAGVNPLDIISDYEISFTLLTPRTDMLRTKFGGDLKMLHIMESRPEVMQGFLSEFIENEGSARAYLARIGVTEAQIKRLAGKLI